MLPKKYITEAIDKFMVETQGGIVDMELVEYLCSLKDSGCSTELFREAIIELFKGYSCYNAAMSDVEEL